MIKKFILYSFLLKFIFFLINLQNSFALGVIIKYYKKNSTKYIDLEKNSELLIDNLPNWINNYNRILTDKDYELLIQSDKIHYHTSNKSLYIYDVTAHLPFEYVKFFIDLILTGNIFYVFFFLFSFFFNTYFLWLIFSFFYKTSLKKKISIIFKKSKIYLYFFVFFILVQFLIIKFNLITLYPEEWSLALIFFLLILFLDLFWGAALLDFKFVLIEDKAYFFFKGLHFEFITFFFFCFIFITIILNIFDAIEYIGQNEYWTKWD